jgi:alpha-aminoadipic semialdehyde synthase
MIGIRREDKNRWETRAPLIPQDVHKLIRADGVELCVQRSPIRVFREEEYVAAGASACDDLDDCSLVLGVKEIPLGKLAPERTYVFFSHTIKGQPDNMPMLRRLMELKCQLIDYERIADEKGRRMVFFGRYAGLAGMIDTLWALGQRWNHEGVENPLTTVGQAYQYMNLKQAMSEIAKVGERIKKHGLPEKCRPLVCGFAGYGQVSEGAQQIYDLLPVEEITPEELASIPPAGGACYKVVFHEKHMVQRLDASSPFDLQEYYDHPDRYRGRFFEYVPHLTVLVNGIYWEPRYPRLITRPLLQDLYGPKQHPRLRVIGDITCDIAGSVECNTHATEPDKPVYVYDPENGETTEGVAGNGPVVLAVDNLPCELPVDSSIHFSRALSPLIPALARADFSAPLEKSGLPPELARATILYHGELTEPYRYLEGFLKD